MSSRGRRLRTGATSVVLVLLGAGSVWGQDDHFPFGPFRMYSVSTEVDGPVTSLELHGRVEGASEEEILPPTLGLRRAEVRGQADRFHRGELSALLEHLAEAYDRLHHGEPELVELSLVNRIDYLREARPVAEKRRTLASWRRP